MTSIICIIPTSLSKRSIYTLKLLLASLSASATGFAALTYEFVTSNTKNTHQLTAVLLELGIEHKSYVINQCNQSAGFSEMNNIIFSKYQSSSIDYFLLVNDDAWVSHSFFKNFARIIKQKRVDIMAPVIIDASILTTKREVIIDSYAVEYFKSGYAKNSTSFANKTQLAAAACLFVSQNVALSMKQSYGFVFNNILYYYLEDVEFSIRARMLGFSIDKSNTLIAYHFGSSTSGKKSYFTMYQTYRNILWLIILTWPAEYIMRNSVNILIVQVWVFFYSVKSFGIKMYIQILIDTLSNFKTLKNMRKKIITCYKKEAKFKSLFSKLLFRTYHGIKIKAI